MFVLTLTRAPLKSSSSYVISKEPSRSTTVMNARCSIPRDSRAVVSTAGTIPGSTTSCTVFPTTSDSPSPCRFLRPSRYRSSLLFRSPSGSVTAILSGSLVVGGFFGRAVLLAVCFGSGLLGLLLLLELLLDLLGDPAHIRLGGGRHALALEDVGTLERPYTLEARSLALAYLRVLPLGEVLEELAVLGNERGPGPLVADLLVTLYLFLQGHDSED